MELYLTNTLRHYCNVSLCKCSAIEPKKIDYFDLTFVLSGSMTYIVNSKTFVLKKNDAIFITPSSLRARLAGTAPVKYVSFNFNIFPHARLLFDTYIPSCISPDIKKLISAFPQSHLSPSYHATEKAANLLNYILFEIMDGIRLSSSNEHVQKIIRYVDEHITKTMSLQSISHEIGLSKEYTAFIFKKEMHQTLVNYINERKMLIAKKLLLNNEMNLTDLSAYLGYNSYNYFSRLFKRYFEISPIALKIKNNM